MVRDLVTNPDEFFSEKVTQAHLRVEIILVAIIGALNTLGILYVGLEILDAREGADMRFAVIGRLLRPILLIFLCWIVYTVVFHFAAAQYRGRGAPSRVFKGVAWALVPLAIGNLAQSVAFFLVYRNENVDELLEGFGASEQMQSLLETGMGDPIMIVATLLFAATLLWSGYLMRYALQHAKDIALEDATRIVGVLVGLHLLAILWAIVQGSPNFSLLL